MPDEDEIEMEKKLRNELRGIRRSIDENNPNVNVDTKFNPHIETNVHGSQQPAQNFPKTVELHNDAPREKQKVEIKNIMGKAWQGLKSAKNLTKSAADKVANVSTTTILFASLILFFSDIGATRFNGISTSQLQFFMTIDQIIPVLLFSLIISLLYWWISGSTVADFFMAFLLTTVTYFLLTKSGGPNLGPIMHIMFAYWVYMSIIRRVSPSSAMAKMYLILLLLLDFLAFPLLGSMTTNLSESYTIISYLANRLIFPFWTVAILIVTPPEAKGARWRRIFTMMLMFMFIFNFMTEYNVSIMDLRAQISPAQEYQAAQYYRRAVQGLGVFKDDILASFKTGLSTFMRTAMGAEPYDVYFGHVHDNEKKKLGVFFTSFSPQAQKFFRNEKPVLLSTVTAEAMGDSLDVTFSCYEKLGTAYGTQGKVDPTNKTVIAYDSFGVTCYFDPMTPGSKTAEIRANYMFQTMSGNEFYTLPASKQFVNGRPQSKQEVLSSIGGKRSLKPIEPVTGGPMTIGLRFQGDHLFFVDEENDQTDTLVLNIGKNADYIGEIMSLEKVQLYLPSGTEITDDAIQSKFIEITDETEIKNALDNQDPDLYEDMKSKDYTFYKLDESELRKPEVMSGVSQYSAKVKITGAAQKGSEITDHLIKLFVEYEYQAKSTATFEINSKTYGQITEPEKEFQLEECSTSVWKFAVEGGKLDPDIAKWVRENYAFIDSAKDKFRKSQMTEVEQNALIAAVSHVRVGESNDVSSIIYTQAERLGEALEDSLEEYSNSNQNYDTDRYRPRVIERALLIFEGKDDITESTVSGFEMITKYKIREMLTYLCKPLTLTVSDKLGSENTEGIKLGFGKLFSDDDYDKLIVYKVAYSKAVASFDDGQSTVKAIEADELITLNKGNYELLVRAYYKNTENAICAESDRLTVKVTSPETTETDTATSP
ncbi:hypothetical protein K9M79_04045 [Candidatus Woesearchaeota archaeon]|nr:hypothetical protein [Candidatus Woesearchaeota archaeon]